MMFLQERRPEWWLEFNTGAYFDQGQISTTWNELATKESSHGRIKAWYPERAERSSPLPIRKMPQVLRRTRAREEALMGGPRFEHQRRPKAQECIYLGQCQRSRNVQISRNARTWVTSPWLQGGLKSGACLTKDDATRAETWRAREEAPIAGRRTKIPIMQ